MKRYLRTSFGPWSAGTAVEAEGLNSDGTRQVTVVHVNPSKATGIDYEDLVFDVDESDLVERRNKTSEVPVMNAKQRRMARHASRRLVNRLIGGR